MTRAQKQYSLWLETLKDDSIYGKELLALEGNDEEILERFHQDLQFGTAGLRGILGAGTNRMNIYTVGKATQGFANYLNSVADNPTVAIAYDSRNFSKEFAHYTASVFAANGVVCHVYQELMPTPALSYAVREFKCDGGVNITASHNPAEYNGYKAYGPDGSQVSTDAASQIMEDMQQIDLFADVKTIDFDEAVESEKIIFIPDSFIEQFIQISYEHALQPEVCEKAGLKVVYTPLNGAGRRSVLSVLELCGMKDVLVVPQQEWPDGNFPTTPYPNPESPDALVLGLELAKKESADLLLATDPDCDRIGIAVLHKGEYRLISGNEIGVLLLDYIINTRKALGTMPEHPFTIRSIVTTKLTDAIAFASQVELKATLTGFKHFGLIIAEEEAKGNEQGYVFAFEESNGYQVGTHVRDKDGVTASQLVVEMASAYKLENKTLVDVLEGFSEAYGHYENYTQNFAFAGVEGMEIMAGIMSQLRKQPPASIGGRPISAYIDYQSSLRTEDGEKKTIDILPSNVLEYELENKSSVIIRPSGTEPKIKVYYLIRGETENEATTLMEGAKKDFTALVEKFSQ